MGTPWDPPIEDDIEVPISALEHFSYCPRQCALIHVEQTYEENLFTIRGRIAHELVDSGEDTARRGVAVVRAIPLWSERHRLRGRADLVELRPDGPYPVEYKAGSAHSRHAEIQLCAQALCLEDMLGKAVPRGAVFYASIRRRREVALDEALRQQTVAVIEAVRAMLRAQDLPEAVNDERCPACSLVHACLPSVVAERVRLREMQRVLFRPL